MELNLMKRLFKHLLQLVLLVNFSAFANHNLDDQLAVKAVIQHYIDGTSKGDPSLIKRAFHTQSSLLLSHEQKPFWQVSPMEYASWFKSAKGKRSGTILSVTIDGDIATARALITTVSPIKQYVDQFLLKRFTNGWLIVSKTATQLSIDNDKQQLASAMNKRVLFIASSADHHGDSNMPTGTSFSELVEAYDVFKNAGYQVDVVSTLGDRLPLAYINTSNEMHKRYLYDQSFMYSLAHTLSPEQVDASRYIAVHYVGGGNAMYQVAENKTLQAISVAVYENNHGIVSSVCHGTAGIVNLKLSNGEYLVAGRKISGYPTAFEKTDAAYYQHFPFDIEQTITQRGGKFNYGKRNQAFVEIDGRVITGTNYQSSRAVALAMVEQMNQM